MDYKYIEQLLEKYWDCQTSIEEEQILKYFFRQKEIPAHLLQYKAVFACLEKEQDLKLTASRRTESDLILRFYRIHEISDGSFLKFFCLAKH